MGKMLIRKREGGRVNEKWRPFVEMGQTKRDKGRQRRGERERERVDDGDDCVRSRLRGDGPGSSSIPWSTFL